MKVSERGKWVPNSFDSFLSTLLCSSSLPCLRGTVVMNKRSERDQARK